MNEDLLKLQISRIFWVRKRTLGTIYMKKNYSGKSLRLHFKDKKSLMCGLVK